MKAITVTVEPDGRVTIPGTRAGQSVTILYDLTSVERAASDPLSPEEQARIAAVILENGKRLRQQLPPDWRPLDHGKWLYGPDGLPR